MHSSIRAARLVLPFFVTVSINAYAFQERNPKPSVLEESPGPENDSAAFFKAFHRRHRSTNTENSAGQLIDSAYAISMKVEVKRRAQAEPVVKAPFENVVYVNSNIPATFKGRGLEGEAQEIPVDGYLALYASVQRAIVDYARVDENLAAMFAVQAVKELVRATDQSWREFQAFTAPYGLSLKYHSKFITRGARQMVQNLEVLRNFDIPYLAGYATAKDARRIYLDYGLPREEGAASGNLVQIDTPLIVHEAFEKALIDELRLPGNTYHRSHQIAQRMEKATVEAMGSKWSEYQGEIMHKHIARAYEKGEKKQLKCTPRDLDLTPYIDEHDDDLIVYMKSVGADVECAR